MQTYALNILIPAHAEYSKQGGVRNDHSRFNTLVMTTMVEKQTMKRLEELVENIYNL